MSILEIKMQIILKFDIKRVYIIERFRSNQQLTSEIDIYSKPSPKHYDFVVENATFWYRDSSSAQKYSSFTAREAYVILVQDVKPLFGINQQYIYIK